MPKLSAKSNVAYASIDVGRAVFQHRRRLSDPTTRSDALRDVGWESGEAVARSAAGVAAGAAVTAALVAAEGTAVVAAAGALATVGAPLVAGTSAAWVAGRAIGAARRRWNPLHGESQ